MIQPVLQNDAFLRDVEQHEGDEGFRLWWLGQSGFLLQWQGRYLLLDPYLSDSLTKKYAATDKPHVRMTARVVAPECLRFVDVVTSSHSHTDHLDPETLLPIFRENWKTQLVVPESARRLAAERSGVPGVKLIGLDAGQTVEISGFKVTGVPAAHETLEKDTAGRLLSLGYIVEFGPWALYHSGDTVRFDTMLDWLKPRQPHVALLPINGRAPERRVAGNLTGAEAASLAQEMGAGVVIPCHFDMFEFNTASPEEFVRVAKQLGQPYAVLRAGEGWSKAGLR